MHVNGKIKRNGKRLQYLISVTFCTGLLLGFPSGVLQPIPHVNAAAVA
ncbi:hypothetical protein [Selenomonas sp.]|nr:hypothetical protein [Selenomonas sp.]MCI6084727.1 hypothetical protein [Selenomonas sp.]MDY3296412.1 hypothetical protein [Selenomonas sp.]MDY4415504.1 hypothetical protein [Selenomonas sp.]